MLHNQFRNIKNEFVAVRAEFFCSCDCVWFFFMTVRTTQISRNFLQCNLSPNSSTGIRATLSPLSTLTFVIILHWRE